MITFSGFLYLNNKLHVLVRSDDRRLISKAECALLPAECVAKIDYFLFITVDGWAEFFPAVFLRIHFASQYATGGKLESYQL